VGGRLTHAGGLAHPFSPSFPSLVPLLVVSREEKDEAEAGRCRFVTGSELDGPSFFQVPIHLSASFKIGLCLLVVAWSSTWPRGVHEQQKTCFLRGQVGKHLRGSKTQDGAAQWLRRSSCIVSLSMLALFSFAGLILRFPSRSLSPPVIFQPSRIETITFIVGLCLFPKSGSDRREGKH
jgi:hypothetical protein